MGAPKGRERPLGAGRKPGSLNKIKTEIRQRAKEFIEHPEVQETMLRQAIEGSLPHQLMALLHYYAYGKPADTIKADVTVTSLLQQIQNPGAVPDSELESLIAEAEALATRRA